MLTMVGLAEFFLGTAYAVSATTLGRVTPAAMMSRITALYLLAQSLIGGGLGPLLVGVAAERLFSGPLALGHAMALCGALFGTATIAAALLLMRTLARQHAAGRRE